MKPEQIRGGGFAGGTFTGAPNVDISSPLRDLSKSLGIATDGVVKALTGDHLRGIDDKKKLALDEAEVFEQTTAGYTSEKLRAKIESEPMLAKFKENPYLLPAINVYRGRKQADELALQMVEAGIDTGDAEGVRAFYEQNAPDLNDPFFARGFNEQNARLQAQFNQQQLKYAITTAEQDRIGGISTVWVDAFNASGGDPAAATAAVRASAFGKSVKGTELTGIQMQYAEKLSVEGKLDELTKLLTSPRDGAPPLTEDLNTAADSARFLAQARERATTATAGFRRQTQQELYDMIDQGVSRTALRASPKFASLAAPGQAEGALSQEQEEVLNRQRSRAEQLRREAEQRELAVLVEERTNAAIADAANKFANGQVFDITDVSITNPVTGSKKSLSANSMIQAVIDGVRSTTLGDEPFALQGPEAQARYSAYFGLLSKNGTTDTRAKKAIAAMTSDVSVAGIQADPGSATQALLMWRSMDVNARKLHSPGGTKEAVLKLASSYLSDNPRMAPEAAMMKAAVRVESPAPKVDLFSASVKKVSKSVQLVDPNGAKEWFGFGKPKDGKFDPDDRQMYAFVQDRINEGLVTGMTLEEAEEFALADAQAMFVAVNGAAVMLPERPDPRGVIPNPAAWAKDVGAVIGAASAAEGIPTDQLKIVATGRGDDSYVLLKSSEDGSTPPEPIYEYSAQEIVRLAAGVRAKASEVMPKGNPKGGQKEPPTTNVADTIEEIKGDRERLRNRNRPGRGDD